MRYSRTNQLNESIVAFRCTPDASVPEVFEKHYGFSGKARMVCGVGPQSYDLLECVDFFEEKSVLANVISQRVWSFTTDTVDPRCWRCLSRLAGMLHRGELNDQHRQQ